MIMKKPTEIRGNTIKLRKKKFVVGISEIIIYQKLSQKHEQLSYTKIFPCRKMSVPLTDRLYLHPVNGMNIIFLIQTNPSQNSWIFTI